MGRRSTSLLIAAAMTALSLHVADACTRVVYLGDAGVVMTARSMDWTTDVRTDLWLFPRGMARDGAAGPRSIRWTSKYGSVVAAITFYALEMANSPLDAFPLLTASRRRPLPSTPSTRGSASRSRRSRRRDTSGACGFGAPVAAGTA